MEFVEGVDKYYMLANCGVTDQDFINLKKSAANEFLKLDQKDKNRYMSFEFDPTPNEYEGIFDQNREISRIIKYMCEKERKQGGFNKISIMNLETGENSAFLINDLGDTKPLIIGCKICGNTDCMLCAGCKKVYYCGKECQKLDWLNSHKKICNLYKTKI